MAKFEYAAGRAEQKIQNARHPEQEQESEASREGSPPSEGAACPRCGTLMPAGALYCGECGCDLRHPAFCPACGAATKPTGDICEACGTWLLEGKCKFCYEPLPPGATFCPVCGNGRDGITCPDCGTLSIFDFCPKCGKALSDFACQALEAAKNDPDARVLVESAQKTAEISAELAEIAKTEAALAAEPINQLPEIPPPAPPKRSLRDSFFTAEQLNAIGISGRQADAAAEKKRAEEEAARIAAEKARREEALRRQREREAAEAALAAKKAAALRKQQEEAAALRAAIEKVRNKTFADPQKARRFHNAMRPPNSQGWRCNAYGCVHSDPNDCACPQGGGMWI
jgi:chemotaxis protein histidine kinase CheA